jgi:hypothetical protein
MMLAKAWVGSLQLALKILRLARHSRMTYARRFFGYHL